jgi:hypothetical protein
MSGRPVILLSCRLPLSCQVVSSFRVFRLNSCIHASGPSCVQNVQHMLIPYISVLPSERRMHHRIWMLRPAGLACCASEAPKLFPHSVMNCGTRSCPAGDASNWIFSSDRTLWCHIYIRHPSRPQVLWRPAVGRSIILKWLGRQPMLAKECLYRFWKYV